MSIKDRLDSLVYLNKPGALVLQGSWGRGKTHFWKTSIVQPILDNKNLRKNLRNYTYVSLFGINNLDDLKSVIFHASEEASLAKKSLTKNLLSIKRWWWILKHTTSLIVSNGDVPFTSAISRAYSSFAFFSIQDRLICLDDIERRGQGLSLLDVMGLVTYLTEQKNCRVVVILNRGALPDSDQAVWDENKEKVFIGELTYAPTADETIGLVLDAIQSEPWVPIARRRLKQLEVTNIRIIQRVKDVIEMFYSSIGSIKLSDESVESIVSTIVIFVFSCYGKGEGAPPIELVMRSNAMSHALDNTLGKNKEKSIVEKKWSVLLSEYGLYLGDDLDLALKEMVEYGYPDVSKLKDALDSHENKVGLQSAKQDWRDAWALYHNHLDENQDQLLAAFKNTWPKVSTTVQANNLQSLVRMLRILEQSDLATQYIKEWVDFRRNGRLEELSSRELSMFDVIDDEEILYEINNALIEINPPPSLREALMLMKDSYGRDIASILVISEAAPEHIVSAIDLCPGPELHEAVQITLSLGSQDANAVNLKAATNMREAIRMISLRSKLSEHRCNQKFSH